MDRAEARRLVGLFFDLDDTLLCEGLLSEAAYRALFRLRESGIRLIPLTGRPASWGELIARMWPVEAAIAENGALAYRRDGRAYRLVDFVSEDERRRRAERLSRLVLQARKRIPELVPADDTHGRVSDYTFDIGEFHTASEETIARAEQLAVAFGARTTRSSVHLHFTFERSDKASGAMRYLRTEGEDVTRALARFAFVGDSQNDAPCFAAFHTTVAVRNLSGVFPLSPRYICRHPKDAGFCEFAEHLVALRR